MSALRTTAAALAAAALMGLGTAASAADTPRPRGTFPDLDLGVAESRGQQALDLLGDRLGAVAAWYRMSPQAFRQALLRDTDLRLDRKGRLYAADEFKAPAQPYAGGTPAVDLAPLSDTFLLNSRPGAKRTIYLDFNGAVLTGTWWNVGTSDPIFAQAYDTDGNPAAFSDAELLNIQRIWQRIAEDFAPFDVNVTTQEPPADALTRTNTADETYGTTALITRSDGVLVCDCGGRAYIGHFDETTNYHKPVLVLYDKLNAGNEKTVAEGASHELGHAVGLLHDGYDDGTYYTPYYAGHGSGITSWAPIMGVSYSRNVTQWSKGEFQYAYNTGDDFAAMASNGLPLLADDHGDSSATATPLTVTASGSTNLLSGGGVIERATDADQFSFRTGVGAATITVTPDTISPNLDVRMEIRTATGRVVASVDTATSLGATLSATVRTPGRYFVRVEGVGYGDPWNTGYSDYDSLGRYTITGSVPAP